MFIKKLHSFKYRNLEEITFESNPTINCIIGQNGVGKTNILDSIYYLAFCKSNLMSNDALNVKHGEDSFILQGLFEDNASSYKINCSYQLQEKEKNITCNDKKYSKFSDHIGLIPLVFISPADMLLINGGGAERRKFIDSYISLFDKEYLQHLVVYNKVLLQRNSLLKQSNIDYTYISILDEKLEFVGTKIFNTRKQTIDELSVLVSKLYADICNTDECSVSYESQLLENSFADLLVKNFEKDKILSYTSNGIHRDDIVFHFNNGHLKNVGSQGQKKTFLLALKFAQYHIIKEKKKTFPILLLDDLFDKLDKERTQKVFDLIDGEEFGQIFITDTNKILLHSFFEQHKQNGSFWLMENGNLTQQ
jgi:DNA replication and repair protein RecF